MSKLLIIENRIEKVLLVCFVLPLLFRQMVVKLLVLFGPHCNISTYTQDCELKITIQTKFDALISNLNSYVKNEIVMTSWWRNIRKISKAISFVSSNPHIYQFSVINYFLSGRYFNYSILLHVLCQWKKQNVWKIAEKYDRICRKSYHYVDDVIRARETSIILNPTF